jgi:hypothetical protein
MTPLIALPTNYNHCLPRRKDADVLIICYVVIFKVPTSRAIVKKSPVHAQVLTMIYI